MTKVDIRRLDSITKNDTTATEQINDNFLALQTAIENTLSRDGTGPNYMDADLDMNSYRIINSADPVEDNDIVNLKYVEERIGGAVEASNTAVSAASQAASSAQSALVSSTNAINTLRNAEEQLNNTITYVDEARQTIDNTIAEAVEDVRQEAVAAAEEVIQEAADSITQMATNNINDYTIGTVIPQLNTLVEAVEEDANSADEYATAAADSANLSRTWATGSDDEVQAIEADEHSSRTYANFSMALANTPEDVPVLQSTLLATGVVQGPKGDKGDSWNGGTLTDIINVVNDSNHPIKITGLAGTSATGYQIVDSNGAGESDFEHYATGDRYGTRIANKSTATGETVNIDLYQTTAGKSVLDLSKPDTILAPQLLDIIFPIGSYYLSEEDSCPLADWMDGCQWEKVGTSLVTAASTAKVRGDGTGFMLANSANTEGAGVSSYGNASVDGSNWMHTAYGAGTAYVPTIGATGMVADLTESSITVNIFRRTM